MSAKVIDLVDAWRRRGRAVPTPADHGPEESSLGARARVRGRQLVVDVLDVEMERIGKLVFSPELARAWSNYFAIFASACAAEERLKRRVAEGLCGSPRCTRKLVAGTERCRKCSKDLATRGGCSRG